MERPKPAGTRINRRLRWREAFRVDSRYWAFCRVGGMCLLLAASAQFCLRLPGTDVPLTLQSLVILLIGLSLSPREAGATIAGYIAGGSAGLPFFAPGSLGLAGPTGGYIIGFLVAAWLVSVLKGQRTATVGRLLAAACAGTAVLFMCGIAWRVVWFWSVDPRLAVPSGGIAFMVPALLKLAVAVSLVVAVRGLSGKKNGYLDDA